MFATSSTSDLDVNEVVDLIVKRNFKRAIFAGRNNDKSLIELCEKSGLDVVRFDDIHTFTSCQTICSWILDQYSTESTELCVASFSNGQWPDILSCGAYCAHKNTSLLLEDPSDLDSIASCLDFVANRKDSIIELTFFGGDSNLNELDRELLYGELR